MQLDLLNQYFSGTKTREKHCKKRNYRTISLMHIKDANIFFKIL